MSDFRELIDTVQRDRTTFHDAELNAAIDTYAEMLHDAARVIGHEWVGMFTEQHLKVFVKAWLVERAAEARRLALEEAAAIRNRMAQPGEHNDKS